MQEIRKAADLEHILRFQIGVIVHAAEANGLSLVVQGGRSQ